MSKEEIIEKLIKLANAIIDPASDILPETYDKELNKYWNFINQLKQNKDELIFVKQNKDEKESNFSNR